MSRAVALIATAGLLAGCGAAAHHARPLASTPLTIPNPAPTGISAPAADVAVIRGWANALRSGNVDAAARYFALPSEMINEAGAGTALVLKIHTPAEAIAAQETLPCGARLISTDVRGRYVSALFALTGRPGPGGSNCGDGAGSTARTNFVIAGGRIVEWIRAPTEPQGRGTSPPSPPSSNVSD